MTTTEILTKLTEGEYEVRAEGECHCTFEWRTYGNNDELVSAHDNSECWYVDCLYVDDELIASNDIFNSYQVHVADPDGEIMAWVMGSWDRDGKILLDDYNGDNPLHNNNERDALVEWLQGRVEAGYKLYRNDMRGFANEYCSIIAGPDADADDDWDEQTPEQWADDYLYTGDAATQAYNSSRVIGTI